MIGRVEEAASLMAAMQGGMEVRRENDTADDR
jgi:hypothetical protein